MTTPIDAPWYRTVTDAEFNYYMQIAKDWVSASRCYEHKDTAATTIAEYLANQDGLTLYPLIPLDIT